MADPLPHDASASHSHTGCSFENGYNVGHEAGVREGYLQGRLSMIEESTKAQPIQEELATNEIAIRFGLYPGQRCTVYRNSEGVIIGATAVIEST